MVGGVVVGDDEAVLQILTRWHLVRLTAVPVVGSSSERSEEARRLVVWIELVAFREVVMRLWIRAVWRENPHPGRTAEEQESHKPLGNLVAVEGFEPPARGL